MIDNTGYPKLIDFGFAKVRNESFSLKGCNDACAHLHSCFRFSTLRKRPLRFAERRGIYPLKLVSPVSFLCSVVLDIARSQFRYFPFSNDEGARLERGPLELRRLDLRHAHRYV